MRIRSVIFEDFIFIFSTSRVQTIYFLQLQTIFFQRRRAPSKQFWIAFSPSFKSFFDLRDTLSPSSMLCAPPDLALVGLVDSQPRVARRWIHFHTRRKTLIIARWKCPRSQHDTPDIVIFTNDFSLQFPLSLCDVVMLIRAINSPKISCVFIIIVFRWWSKIAAICRLSGPHYPHTTWPCMMAARFFFEKICDSPQEARERLVKSQNTPQVGRAGSQYWNTPAAWAAKLDVVSATGRRQRPDINPKSTYLVSLTMKHMHESALMIRRKS